ncbi:MAG: hypothetical protein JST85_18820 [Acidobacteria bacterium]|nr:hypothetical protein [Acidobacteriota bacterium]
MIVLDEQLIDPKIVENFQHWYKGFVTNILDLGPRTQVDDDAIPTLLRAVKQPTFVTINYSDFWKKAKVSRSYCIICLKLSGERSREVPRLVQSLLKMKEYSTKRARMGKVISWSDGKINHNE